MDTTDKKWKALLEKWNSGNFTRADEEALQRLMADANDDFLREATEGYLSNSEADHQAGLERLGQRLSFPQETAPRSTQWPRWAAAAAAALILVSGIWWLNRVPDEQSISGRLPIEQPSAAENSATSDNSDSRTNKQKQQPSAPGSTAATEAGAVARPQPDSMAPSEVALNSEVAKDAKLELEPTEEMVVAAPAAPQKTFQNATGDPENDLLKTSENTRQADKKPVQVQPNASPNNVVLPTTSKARDGVKATAQPTPEGGWEKFKKDMEKEMKVTQQARDNGVKSGLVNMILDIKPTDGKVRSVLFINRLGFGCDELAEQFVRRYTWVTTPGGPTQIEVEIEFQ